ncbi:hypothetical protein PAPYR_4785 [Paratrimastix pyriformis]|uniref:Uncharacterized protein n=1 Tax=Paratrimastix pyriformis TaxID=342808 RepID=A0ABQ8UJ49_9EUKA|nr:hypothetical protein PAPYR_4785 [Paratrimastix pyriformis]
MHLSLNPQVTPRARPLYENVYMLSKDRYREVLAIMDGELHIRELVQAAKGAPVPVPSAILAAAPTLAAPTLAPAPSPPALALTPSPPPTHEAAPTPAPVSPPVPAPGTEPEDYSTEVTALLSHEANEDHIRDAEEDADKKPLVSPAGGSAATGAADREGGGCCGCCVVM